MRGSYFASLRQAFVACRNLDDLEVSVGIVPIVNLVDAMELRSYITNDIGIDTRVDSGLPIFDRVAMVKIDHDRYRSAEGQAEIPQREAFSNSAVNRALDEIILDKRRPSPVVSRDLAKAGYELFLSRCRSMHTGLVGPIQSYSESNGALSETDFTWSYWDTTTSRPVRCFVSFEKGRGQTLDFLSRLQSIARNFDTLSFPMVAIAAAVDAEFPDLGIRNLTRVIYGPFFSPLFMRENDHPLVRAIADSGQEEQHLWTLAIRREDLRYSGTNAWSGFWRRRSQRIFDVDATDPECEIAGATSIKNVLVAPYSVSQRLMANPELKPFLVRRRLKSVTTGGTILK